MRITIKEHTIPEQTHWGTVNKSLNQHIVSMEVDGIEKQCGYVSSTNVFMPLCGFPAELVDIVATKCTEALGVTVTSTPPPPSIAQVQAIIDAHKSSSATDSDDEGDDE